MQKIEFSPLRAAFCAVVVCELLAACGSSDAPGGASAAKADVTVTVDGVHHACIVALSTEGQGSSIDCAAVVAFLKDELRVPSGAVYDLRTIPEASKAEVAAVPANLKGAGYRFVGDR
jgi:hypothetical protein